MTFKVGDRVNIDTSSFSGYVQEQINGRQAVIKRALPGDDYFYVLVDGDEDTSGNLRSINAELLSLVIPRDFVAELQALVNDARAAGYTVEAKITETKETVL